MEAGIMMMEGNIPCIFYEGKLPHPVKYIAFSKSDHTLTLVYDIPGGSKKFTQGYKFPFPLDARFVEHFRDGFTAAIAPTKNGQPVEIEMHLVIFTK
jgi:hypothetical protein